MIVLIAGGIAFAVWLVLVFARDGFWLTAERDARGLPPEPAIWPAVTAVVPARDEADVIARSIGSLLAQEYPGDFRVILVDDNSSDGTGEIARSIVSSSPSPSGVLAQFRPPDGTKSAKTGLGWGLSTSADSVRLTGPTPFPSPEGEGCVRRYVSERSIRFCRRDRARGRASLHPLPTWRGRLRPDARRYTAPP